MSNAGFGGNRLAAVLAGAVMMTMPAFGALAAPEPAQTAAPGMAAARYADGVSWEKFLAGTKVQRDLWLKNAGRDVPPELVDRMKRAGADLRLLVVAVDWCPDSVGSVPYIARLASRAGVALRLVDFKTGKGVMEAHHTPDGRASTPTVVLLRGDQEVAAWVERPATLQWWYLDHADQLSEDELLERKMAWYDWNRGADALNEIVVLAEQTARKGQGGMRSTPSISQPARSAD